MDSKLSPTKVANLLSVSASTVRRLTGLYSDYFSPDATPAAGGRRFYTAEDVETLRTIIDMQNAGIAEPDIIAQLDRGVTLPAEPTNPTTDLAERFSALPQPVVVKLDTDALARPLQAVADAVRESSAAQDRQSAAMDRLATSLLWFAAALVAIVLITVAVASGWIG